MDIARRKEDHVLFTATGNAGYRNKDNGFSAYELPYNALPEVNLSEIDTTLDWLGHKLALPILVSSMTGGYDDAKRINTMLAEVAEHHRIPIGAGSARATLESEQYADTYTVIRKYAPSVPVLANIGAIQLARGIGRGQLDAMIELLEADALVVHLNPLQELMQPEGETDFCGVLHGRPEVRTRGLITGIEELIQVSKIPVIVKEVGAGISGDVAKRLAAVGVSIIDVAGAGGTSWASVEISRRTDGDALDFYRDFGIPTAQCLLQCREMVGSHVQLIASGGISCGNEVAIAIALGAELAGAARPVLKAVLSGGPDAAISLLETWALDLRRMMFLTGADSLSKLKQVKVLLR